MEAEAVLFSAAMALAYLGLVAIDRVLRSAKPPLKPETLLRAIADNINAIRAEHRTPSRIVIPRPIWGQTVAQMERECGGLIYDRASFYCCLWSDDYLTRSPMSLFGVLIYGGQDDRVFGLSYLIAIWHDGGVAYFKPPLEAPENTISRGGWSPADR